jgi:hypothetical protein
MGEGNSKTSIKQEIKKIIMVINQINLYQNEISSSKSNQNITKNVLLGFTMLDVLLAS